MIGKVSINNIGLIVKLAIPSTIAEIKAALVVTLTPDKKKADSPIDKAEPKRWKIKCFILYSLAYYGHFIEDNNASIIISCKLYTYY